MKKRKTHEIDELLKKKAEEAKGFKKKKKVKEENKKLTLAEKKALKKQKIEAKKRSEEDKLLEEYQLDNIAFGEVVDGPPTLNTKPRHADKLEGAPRVSYFWSRMIHYKAVNATLILTENGLFIVS